MRVSSLTTDTIGPTAELHIHLDLPSHTIVTLAFKVSEKSNCCYLASNNMKGN